MRGEAGRVSSAAGPRRGGRAEGPRCPAGELPGGPAAPSPMAQPSPGETFSLALQEGEKNRSACSCHKMQRQAGGG